MAQIPSHIAGHARLGLASLVVGLVSLASACSKDTAAPTAPESEPALAVSAAATPLTFRMVATGLVHTCGTVPTNFAYCWGNNENGQLGDGTTQNRTRPTPVARNLRFVQVDGGYFHTCGVTAASLAFCWGLNDHGQLGFGGLSGRLQPMQVAGGLHWRQVALGPFYSCGVTTDDRAYCWGQNFGGQLGDGTTAERHVPTPVAGGLRFRRVDVGGYTCGLTTGDKVYCWGGGNGTPGSGKPGPTAIPGGRSFRQATAGCAITADRKGYCWQNLGTPALVPGGFSWNTLVRNNRTCGVTTANKAYCWGDNFTGALGDGTETDRTNPTAVLGGLLFAGVDAGPGWHTCGVTTAGRAYCWGHNPYGELGLGTNTGPQICGGGIPCSKRPRPVVGPT